MAAATLKAFSLSPSTKQLYRRFGNSFGARKRTTGVMPDYYFQRIERMLKLNAQYGFLRDGCRLLELGTGWLHWEAITCRLFYDVEAVLYDVWDNRQLSGLKNYIIQLDSLLHKLDVPEESRKRAHQLIGAIKETKGFQDLYELLGFQYMVDESGRLRQLPKESFDVVVSAGVLEHVGRKEAAGIVDDVATVLKEGGYSCHSIHIADHLSAYDRSASVKQYLRYSDRTWQRWFQNDVQYINRIQRSDWLGLFEKSGLTLLEEEAAQEDLSGLKVSRDFQHYTEPDLRCSNLKLLHRKTQ